MADVKKGVEQGFWKEVIHNSFKKDIPIVIYVIYLWFGVIENGLTRIYQITSSDLVSTSIILTLIILPILPVMVRVWRT